MTLSPKEAAASYLERGWAVVPLSPEDKRPTAEGWPALAHARAFELDDFEGSNVGVVLGTTSGDLVDIDLDSQAAIALAPYFLPPTLTFGRASKPVSHWLYISKGVRSHKLRFTVDEEQELVEVRSTNAATDACGSQTAFPGSTNPSGERVEWTPGCPPEPLEVPAGDLLWAVCRLTVGAIILQRYAEGGSRNAQTLGLAGGLLKAGWTAEEVTELFDAVREASGDDRAKDASAVERTIDAFAAGQEVTGFGSLIEDGVLPEQTIAEIQKHARTPETRAKEVTLARTRMGSSLKERYLAEARETDGMTAAYALVRPANVSNPPAAVSSPSPDALGELSPIHPFDAFGDDVDLDKEPEPLDYFWGPFAPGKVSAIQGFANAGKSPFLQSLLMHSAAGIPKFCGMPITKQKCAILDFETGRLAEIRLRRLAHGLGLEKPPTADLRMKHMRELMSPEMLEALEDWVRVNEIGVLGIDTYGAAIGAVDHNAPEFSLWLKNLGILSRDAGVLIIVLLHEKKTDQGKRKGLAIEMISGHGSAPGALQGCISLYHPDEEDLSRVTVHCSRAPEQSFETFDVMWQDVPNPKAGTSSVAAGLAAKWGLAAEVVERVTKTEKAISEPAQIEAAMPKVLDLMNSQAHDGTPMLYKDVAGAVQGNTRIVGLAIDALVKAGRLSADYLLGAPPSRTRPRHIWLPRRPKSIAGTIQG